jgi:hypothetical protein
VKYLLESFVAMIREFAISTCDLEEIKKTTKASLPRDPSRGVCESFESWTIDVDGDYK